MMGLRSTPIVERSISRTTRSSAVCDMIGLYAEAPKQVIQF
jgi:hypothetical protein